MKKQKAKKGGATKKKDEKPEAAAEESSSHTEEKPEEVVEDEKTGDGEKDGEIEASAADDTADAEKDDKVPERPSPHGRQPSLSIQSKMRSDSFRRTSSTQGPGTPIKSPASSFPPISPGSDAHEVYKKQAARIEELERENKRLAGEAKDAETRWRKTEEQMEELREASGDVAELKSKADQAKTMGSEVEKLVSFSKMEACALEWGVANHGAIVAEIRDHYTAAPERTASIASCQTTTVRRIAFCR